LPVGRVGVREFLVLKKNPLILIAIGVVLLAIGGFMQFSGGPPRADPALVQACETSMTERGADAALIAQCREAAFASAMTATDAESAARAISAANRSEVGGGALSMFMLGMGLALLVGGLFLKFKQKPA